MGKGRKGNVKKSGVVKLSPAVRSEVTHLVDQLIKKCSKVPSQASASVNDQCSEFENIYNIVEQIREREKCIQLPSYNRAEQMKEFSSWADTWNIKHGKVAAASCGSKGWGMVCRDALQEGEAVIEVPWDAILTEDHAAHTYLASMAKNDNLVSQMANVRLALVLLIELLSPASKWGPYVRSLPRDCYTPLYCRPSHIARLRHSPVLESVVKQYRNIGRHYAYVYRLLRSVPEARDWPLTEHFTYDAYRWAVCCVSTRVNRLPAPGGEGRLALVPAWDLVNHAQGKMSTDFLVDEKKLVCYAGRPFGEDEQFTMHYGNRTNSDLFLHSGFVTQDNPSACVALRLGVSKTDPLYEAKTAALRALQVDLSGPGGSPCEVVAGEAPVSAALWSFAVVFCAGESLISSLESSPEPSAVVEDVLQGRAHADVRAAATTFLRTRLALLLRAYESALSAQSPAAEEEASDEEARSMSDLVTALLQSERRLLLAAATHLDTAAAAP